SGAASTSARRTVFRGRGSWSACAGERTRSRWRRAFSSRGSAASCCRTSATPTPGSPAGSMAGRCGAASAWTGPPGVWSLATPRAYRGVDALAAAVARLGRRDVVLAVVGADPGGPTARRLAAQCPGVLVVGSVPFEDVPAYLEAADVVAVPQRDTTDTRGQVPAKLFDALAFGRPLAPTRVS